MNLVFDCLKIDTYQLAYDAQTFDFAKPHRVHSSTYKNIFRANAHTINNTTRYFTHNVRRLIFILTVCVRIHLRSDHSQTSSRHARVNKLLRSPLIRSPRCICLVSHIALSLCSVSLKKHTAAETLNFAHTHV